MSLGHRTTRSRAPSSEVALHDMAGEADEETKQAVDKKADKGHTRSAFDYSRKTQPKADLKPRDANVAQAPWRKGSLWRSTAHFPDRREGTK